MAWRRFANILISFQNILHILFFPRVIFSVLTKPARNLYLARVSTTSRVNVNEIIYWQFQHNSMHLDLKNDLLWLQVTFILTWLFLWLDFYNLTTWHSWHCRWKWPDLQMKVTWLADESDLTCRWKGLDLAWLGHFETSALSILINNKLNLIKNVFKV